VVRHLIADGHEVHVATAVPEFVFTAEVRSPRLRIRRVILDCGAVQADALTVDPLATLDKVSSALRLSRSLISHRSRVVTRDGCRLMLRLRNAVP
jgi:L-arabinokinase